MLPHTFCIQNISELDQTRDTYEHDQYAHHYILSYRKHTSSLFLFQQEQMFLFFLITNYKFLTSYTGLHVLSQIATKIYSLLKMFAQIL